MPVNRDALGGLGAQPLAAEGQPALETGTKSTQPEEEPTGKPPRRRRRSSEEVRAEKIAKAKVPQDDEEVTVVFKETGATEKRLWPEAVALRRTDKVELNEKHEFAFLKIEQEEAARRAADDAEFDGDEIRVPRGDQPVQATIEGAKVTWPWSQLVEHIVVNGNDNVVFEGDYYPRAMGEERRRYQAAAAPPPDPGARVDEPPPVPPASPVGPGDVGAGRVDADEIELGPLPAARGEARSEIESMRQETPVVEQVDTLVWRVGMGYVEKIGLPEYSSLSIGPCTASRHVIDDGRRERYELTGRNGNQIVELPATVVEALREAAQICEVVMRAERQSMINFLEQAKAGAPPA